MNSIKRLGVCAIAGALAAAVITYAPEASAMPCVHRGIAHQAEHGGFAVDSAWHVANGELPTCDSSEPVADNDYQDNDNREDNSRFCERHWFC